MFIKILFLISFVQMAILINLVQSENPMVDLANVQFLIFEKYKKTSGDRSGSNPVDQLNCVGDHNLCITNLILKTTCHNKGKKFGQKRLWRCEAALDTNIEFDKVDVNCVKYYTDSFDEDRIVKGSCSLDYSLRRKRAKFTVMKIVTIASVAIAIISICYSLIYNNRLKNTIESLKAELSELRSANSTANSQLPNTSLSNNQFIPPINNQYIAPHNQFNNSQFASAPPPAYQEDSKFAYSNTNYR